DGASWSATGGELNFAARAPRSAKRTMHTLSASRLPSRPHWQDEAPLRFPGWSERFETQFFIHSNRPSVVRMRIGRAHGRSLIKESLHSRADKRCPVPGTDHFRVCNELVNSPRTLGKFGKMVIFPPMNRVVLHEREGASEG